MNAYVTSQYPPPAPPALSSGGPLVTPVAPSTKRMRTLVVDDSDAQAPAASGSDGTPKTFLTVLSDITATSWADVASSSLAMSGADDSPSRGRMLPMPGLSTSAPPPPVGAPTPHEALIQGQQRSKKKTTGWDRARATTPIQIPTAVRCASWVYSIALGTSNLAFCNWPGLPCSL